MDDQRARRPTAPRLLLGLAEQSSEVARLAQPVLVRCQRLASLNRHASFHGRLGAAAGLPPDAIASHAEPVEVKAGPREEVAVGRGGPPLADP
jgi:hypothetical protein